jgi:hypothetical protein
MLKFKMAEIRKYSAEKLTNRSALFSRPTPLSSQLRHGSGVDPFWKRKHQCDISSQNRNLMGSSSRLKANEKMLKHKDCCTRMARS